MQGESKESSFQDTALKRAVSHPRRLEMLDLLAKKETGIDQVELAEALGLNPSLVKYHLRILCSADMVAHVEGSEPGTIDRYVVVAGADA
jgi:predicted ArsR family transcriptional regulator